MSSALKVPPLLVEMLSSFAQELYDAGTPLHYYRQLLAFTQREVPAVRPFVTRAWEFVRWETLEPLQHRPPLPEPVLKAMVCPARPAVQEPLKACRELLEQGWSVYVRVQEPQTRKRGAVVQHVRVEALEPVHRFIAAVLRPLLRMEQLYSGHLQASLERAVEGCPDRGSPQADSWLPSRRRNCGHTGLELAFESLVLAASSYVPYALETATVAAARTQVQAALLPGGKAFRGLKRP